MGKIVAFLIIGIFFLLVFQRSYDITLTNPTTLEKDFVVARQEFFAEGLGKLYRNRFGIRFFNEIRPILTKFNRNLFSNLDPNNYFNFSSPLSLLSIPFFALGLYGLFERPRKILVVYFFSAFFLSGFLSPESKYGLFLFLPLFYLCTLLGISMVLGKIKKELVEEA